MQESMYVNENYLKLFSHCEAKQHAFFDDAIDLRAVTSHIESLMGSQASSE